MISPTHPPYSPTFSTSSKRSYASGTSELSAVSTFTAASTITSQPYLPIAEAFSNSFTSPITEYPIEHIDTDVTWYRKYFIHNRHPTFVGNVEPFGPVIISLTFDCQTINNNSDNIYWYRYILRKKELPDDRGVLAGPPPGSEPPWDVLLKMISRELVQPHLIKLITTPELSEQLLSIDENGLQKAYKIGVLYCAPSQSTEEEWFSNKTTSKAFSNFLEILGTKVKLLGFEGFSGGLDTKTDGTGEYSIYDGETFKDHEIMYHVSTMIPYEKSNKHQITRKRHIGNDIVCIVFQDVATPFSPFAVRSQFLHVYVIVSPVVNSYRVEIVCKDGVPYFGPPLPNPPIFEDPISLRKFLVSTVINGQNAAWKTPKLSEPFLRARSGIINDLVNKFALPTDEDFFLTPPQSPKKQSPEELSYILKGLFIDQIKCKGKPPDMTIVKELLDKGANPHIRLPQPKPLKSVCSHNSSKSMSNGLPLPSNSSHHHHHTHRKSPSSSSLLNVTSNHQKLHKLPNILFATIALTDDPIYVKFLINYGVETMTRDSHFPNAFVFAATCKRVETMRCLLENVPALSDPESVDTAINDTYNRAYSRNTNNNDHTNGYVSYGSKLWSGLTFRLKGLTSN